MGWLPSLRKDCRRIAALVASRAPQKGVANAVRAAACAAAGQGRTFVPYIRVRKGAVRGTYCRRCGAALHFTGLGTFKSTGPLLLPGSLRRTRQTIFMRQNAGVRTLPLRVLLHGFFRVCSPELMSGAVGVRHFYMSVWFLNIPGHEKALVQLFLWRVSLTYSSWLQKRKHSGQSHSKSLRAECEQTSYTNTVCDICLKVC